VAATCSRTAPICRGPAHHLRPGAFPASRWKKRRQAPSCMRDADVALARSGSRSKLLNHLLVVSAGVENQAAVDQARSCAAASDHETSWCHAREISR
jgi:hypothetical protein